MLVLLSRDGQMCNQLISLSSIYSLGIEYEQAVKCPCMDSELKKYFKFDAGSNDFCFEESKYSNIILKIIRFWNIFSKAKEFKHENTKKTFYFTKWLETLDHQIFYKHIDRIRSCFAFREEVLKEIENVFCSVKDPDSVTIGVHIRRGDYKEFNNGKWYYSDAEYAKIMLAVQEKMKKKATFYVCSNEKIDLNYYKNRGLNIVRPGKTAIDDLGILSLCDYIMGPPSTYSFWASLLGRNKRLIIDGCEKIYTLEDFETVDARLERGETIQ